MGGQNYEAYKLLNTNKPIFDFRGILSILGNATHIICYQTVRRSIWNRMMATINVCIHVTRVGHVQGGGGGLLPKVAVSLLLWSPSATIFVHILVAESWFGAE